jgi:hypothetical protein
MTQTTSQLEPGEAVVHPKLRELLEEGKLDWTDPRQREAYLKAWIKGVFRQEKNS